MRFARILIAGLTFLSSIFTVGVNGAFAAGEASVWEPPVRIPAEREWILAVDPFYGWLPGFNGNVQVFGGSRVNVDVSVTDILERLGTYVDLLDGLYMGSGELRHGRYGLQWDLVYMNVSGSTEFGNRIKGAADIGFKLTMGTLAGNYRFYETSSSHVDAIAGLRVTEVGLDIVATLGPLGATRSGEAAWLDPVVGIKGRHQLGENWYVKGSALYGGFGVSSKRIYDLSAFVGHEWVNGAELYGGWRLSSTEYKKGAFTWDIDLSGPMVGLTFKF